MFKRAIQFLGLLGLSCLLPVISSVVHADELPAAVYINPNEGLPYIVIKGRISEETLADIQRLLPRVAKKYTDGGPIFTVDSMGGSVDAAIEIGYLLRKLKAWVIVLTDSECVSSCVFILAGAVIRGPYGKVGIHRPHDPENMVFTAEEQKEKYNKLEKKIKTFLAEVNIPLSLYDEMIRISPSDVKYLSEDDLSRTGLGQDDPYFAEAKTARESARLGISTVEYARRLKYMDSVCLHYPEEKQLRCLRAVYVTGNEPKYE